MQDVTTGRDSGAGDITSTVLIFLCPRTAQKPAVDVLVSLYLLCA